MLPSILLFAVTWSVGATCDKAGRVTFDTWLRKKVAALQKELPTITAAGEGGDALNDQQALDAFQGLASGLMPEGAAIYEWCFQRETKQWVPWMSTIPEFKCNPDMPFSQITVPTADTVRYTYLLDVLLAAGKHVLCVGDTGTGKTLTVVNKLLGAMPPEVQPSFMTFSARTSANQTQDIIGESLCPCCFASSLPLRHKVCHTHIRATPCLHRTAQSCCGVLCADAKMDKRRKGVYGPPSGKKAIVFVDDLNMPQV